MNAMDPAITGVAERPITNTSALYGAVLLLFGVMVYILFRPANSLWLLPNSVFFKAHVPPYLRLLTGSLPALMHTGGFSLLTCAILGGTRRANAKVCLSWVLINGLFEIGQLQPIATRIGILFGSDHFGFFTAYFLRGVFDFNDLIGNGIGAMLAWNVMYPRWRKE